MTAVNLEVTAQSLPLLEDGNLAKWRLWDIVHEIYYFLKEKQEKSRSLLDILPKISLE